MTTQQIVLVEIILEITGKITEMKNSQDGLNGRSEIIETTNNYLEMELLIYRAGVCFTPLRNFQEIRRVELCSTFLPILTIIRALILLDVNQYLLVVFTYNVMANDVAQVSPCRLTCTYSLWSSFVYYLLSLLCPLLNGLFFNRILASLYISWVQAFCQMYVLQIFSPSGWHAFSLSEWHSMDCVKQI